MRRCSRTTSSSTQWIHTRTRLCSSNFGRSQPGTNCWLQAALTFCTLLLARWHVLPIGKQWEPLLPRRSVPDSLMKMGIILISFICLPILYRPLRSLSVPWVHHQVRINWLTEGDFLLPNWRCAKQAKINRTLLISASKITGAGKQNRKFCTNPIPGWRRKKGRTA